MSALDADFARVLDGAATPDETKAFLLHSIERMRDPQALAAGARALRARMIAVAAPDGAIDVCGTGGDGAHTLNISTAAAFVVAGCGVPVAKHGNRAMSSKCGAADVLEALGVKLTGDAATLERCLREANVAFLFAQNHHPAMRHVAAARREVGQRTIFNLLGPLANPAGVKRQFMGVFGADFVEPAAQALRLLGTERAWVVHGAGGLDELSLEDGNEIAELRDGEIRLRRLNGREPGALSDSCENSNAAIGGGAADENAAALRSLLDGQGRDGYRRTVVLNAAAALVIAGEAPNLQDGYDRAEGSISSGWAQEALQTLIALTQAAP